MNTIKETRILIVDDEDSYRTPIANHMRSKGYVVDTAANAEQSLALLKYNTGNYDVIFIDQELHAQEIDGIELTGRIHESYPDIPLVMVTGWSSQEKGIRALRNGAYRYISKSAGIQELELLIQMVFEIKNDSGKSPLINRDVTPNRNRILVVFANPLGSDPLRLGAEDRVIRECINLSKYRDNISLDVLHAATIHDVRRALLDNYYRIVQFSGHGTGQSLAFENEIGQMQLISQEVLTEFLAAYSPPIECVILNACYSKLHRELISYNIPYIIGMDGAISDKGATEFTRGFYDAIGAGKDIEFAYQEGCRTIKLLGLPDSAMPILLM